MLNILVIHGPNLNLLGIREPEIYGSDTLEQINERLVKLAKQNSAQVEIMQSNAEHELINSVQKAHGRIDFIIINPAAFGHTSIALRDAFLAVGIPFIEVHLSNTDAREPFRQHSYLSDIAVGKIIGLGARGYEFALDAAIDYCQTH
ncbi:MAG: type 3-dehydroquinate dehydratase [Gammaproteobacteria bacterium]|jgi:3-dehydroquinate dehydratase-2|nr:type 3-dehydroquinate dehydratase [Gammaproteobacteria bacterium]